MSNVVDINCITTLDIDPDKILNTAAGELDSCIVIGWDKEGEMYFASSKADGADALWLLEAAKLKLLGI